MSKNIGSKIQTFSIILFALSVVGSVIGAIALLIEKGAIGLLLLFGGPLLSGISTMFLYAFGELVIRIIRIDERINGNMPK